MQIISISRGSFSEGKELAEELAARLDYACVGREDLVEAATASGITVGKLETAMLKPRAFGGRLLLEKEHFQAFATAYLCERALSSNLVYHGRTGHLLLPGISHLLRLRVVENLERRINAVMTSKHIPWDKARRYIEAVDDDRRRWVQVFYGLDWDAASHYDMTLNLEQTSVSNAASALCAMAALPDYEITVAGRHALEDIRLAARARVALARDERTWDASFRVTADRGAVLVTYQPRDARVASAIEAVVGTVEGVREISSTMAATNILWVQETFSPDDEHYQDMVELARHWNAAVELMRFVPDEEEAPESKAPALASPASEAGARAALPGHLRRDGGIEDDLPAQDGTDDGGLHDTHDRLARDGVAGGQVTCRCHTTGLLDLLGGRASYSLIVLGDVFTSKGHAAQVRKRRELATALTDNMKLPVVDPSELAKTYGATPRRLLSLGLYLAISAVMLAFVLANQGPVLEFLHSDDTTTRILAAITTFLVVPTFAYLYGSFTKGVLRLLHVE